jgi:hypothetical protein
VQKLRGTLVSCEAPSQYRGHVILTCTNKRAAVDPSFWTPEVAEEYGACTRSSALLFLVG